eukprot:3791971-Prymnesium_polylepis.1
MPGRRRVAGGLSPPADADSQPGLAGHNEPATKHLWLHSKGARESTRENTMEGTIGSHLLYTASAQHQ